MKKIILGLFLLASFSTFASDCDSLIGDYLCKTKYNSTTVQIDRNNSGYQVTEIDHRGGAFSEPNSKTHFQPTCVANNKLDYKESYFVATFFIKIRPHQSGIKIESGFEGAKETGTEVCVRK